MPNVLTVYPPAVPAASVAPLQRLSHRRLAPAVPQRPREPAVADIRGIAAFRSGAIAARASGAKLAAAETLLAVMVALGMLLVIGHVFAQAFALQ